MSVSRITLLVPGFFQSDHIEHGLPINRLFEALDVQSFWKLLSRADTLIASDTPMTHEHQLLKLFGWQLSNADELPIGALYRPGDSSGVWAMKADPVYLQPGLNEVSVTHPQELAITEQEAVVLIRDINAHFDSPDWHLKAITAESWLILGTRSFDVKTTALSQSRRCEPKLQLPQGADGAYWRQVLTELQMLLHEHPVNQARKSLKHPINSLWLWGGGMSTNTPRCPWDCVISNESLSVAACRYCGLEAIGRPPNVSELLAKLAEFPNSLIIFDDLLSAVRTGDLGRWRTDVESLINQWMTPVLAATYPKTAVTIDFGIPKQFLYSARMARRWWRKTKDPASLCGAGK